MQLINIGHGIHICLDLQHMSFICLGNKILALCMDSLKTNFLIL